MVKKLIITHNYTRNYIAKSEPEHLGSSRKGFFFFFLYDFIAFVIKELLGFCFIVNGTLTEIRI